MIRRISLSIILVLVIFCCSGCIKSEPKTGLETVKRLHEAVLNHDKDFVSRHVDIENIFINIEKSANNVYQEATKEKEIFRQMYWIHKCPLYITNEDVMPTVKKVYAQELIDMIGNEAFKKAVTDNVNGNFCLEQLRRIFDFKNLEIARIDWEDEEKNLVLVTIKGGKVVPYFDFIVRTEKENQIWKAKEIVNLEEYVRRYYFSYLSELADLNRKEFEKMRKYVSINVDVDSVGPWMRKYKQWVESVQVTAKNIGEKGIENVMVAVYIYDGLSGSDNKGLLYSSEFQIEKYIEPGMKEGVVKKYRNPAGKNGSYISSGCLILDASVEEIEFDDGSVIECSRQLP